jgi:glutaredoxin 3
LDFPQPPEFPQMSASESPPITLYTSAMCGYCVAAKNFLKSRGLSWDEVRIDLDPVERERMVARARRTTVPQIFIGETHVGGYDDLMALHRAGKLEPLLGKGLPGGGGA